jgi:hypothetical protein
VGIKMLFVSALVVGAVHHFGGNHGSSYEDTNNTTRATPAPPTNTSDYTDYTTQRTTPYLDR